MAFNPAFTLSFLAILSPLLTVAAVVAWMDWREVQKDQEFQERERAGRVGQPSGMVGQREQVLIFGYSKDRKMEILRLDMNMCWINGSS